MLISIMHISEWVCNRFGAPQQNKKLQDSLMDNIKIEIFDIFNMSKSMSNGSSKLAFKLLFG
jgi:hypothetical protein